MCAPLFLSGPQPSPAASNVVFPLDCGFKGDAGKVWMSLRVMEAVEDSL